VAVHAGARRHLLDGLQLGGGAQHFFHHPAQLARQRREHRGELVQELARGGARLFVRQDFAQPRGVIVDPAEHDGVDAGVADGEEDRGGGGGERRVQDERQGGEQHAQALDLPGAGAALELRIDGRQLHRAGADCRQGVIPVARLHDREPRGGGPAQLVKLVGGDSG